MTLLRLAALATPLCLCACEVNVEQSGDDDDTGVVGDDDDAGPGDDDDDDDTVGDDDDDDAGGDGHAADCAGPLDGTYQLDGYPLDGNVEGELLADGTLRISFVSTSGDTDAEGYVSPSGVMSGEHQGVSIDGTYDFSSCSGDGTWIDFNVGATGTYELALE